MLRLSIFLKFFSVTLNYFMESPLNIPFLAIDTIQLACTTPSTPINASATTANTTDTGDKCKNGVSQYLLAPMIVLASLFALLA